MLAKTRHNHFITICQELSLLATGQLNRSALSAGNRVFQITIPGQFQQTSSRTLVAVRYRATSHQITWLKIAAIAAVMRQHLGHGPIHITKIALAKDVRGMVLGTHFGRRQRNL